MPLPFGHAYTAGSYWQECPERRLVARSGALCVVERPGAKRGGLALSCACSWSWSPLPKPIVSPGRRWPRFQD